MHNDISIQGVSPLGASGDLPSEHRASSAIAPALADGAPMHPNPSQRLDPALGLVVIEFRDASGNVTDSIPTERQLQAYRLHQNASDAAMPPGIAAPMQVAGVRAAIVGRSQAAGVAVASAPEVNLSGRTVPGTGSESQTQRPVLPGES
jgi:hypothetical protein